MPLILAIFLLLLARPAAAQTYTITDLGSLYPNAINDAGQVVGGETLWQNGTVTHLGRLVSTCHATAINNRGQIVGTSGSGTVSAMTEANVHAFLWQNGKMTDLGSPKLSSQYYVTGINDSGQVIGTSYRHPLLWENGRKMYLPKLYPDPPYTQVFCATFGMNNRGQSVGYAASKAGDRHAVLWQKGRILELGGAGGHDAQAFAINDHGQIVGSATSISGVRHASLWQNGKRYDLKLLRGDTDSEADAINNTGSIVGASRCSRNVQFWSRAFLWQNGRMRNLNALIPQRSRWHLDSASGINNRGQIIGYGTYHGKPRGYLLTPKSQ